MNFCVSRLPHYTRNPCQNDGGGGDGGGDDDDDEDDDGMCAAFRVDSVRARVVQYYFDFFFLSFLVVLLLYRKVPMAYRLHIRRCTYVRRLNKSQ